jgi:hypothetical protein
MRVRPRTPAVYHLTIYPRAAEPPNSPIQAVTEAIGWAMHPSPVSVQHKGIAYLRAHVTMPTQFLNGTPFPSSIHACSCIASLTWPANIA